MRKIFMIAAALFLLSAQSQAFEPQPTLKCDQRFYGIDEQKAGPIARKHGFEDAALPSFLPLVVRQYKTCGFDVRKLMVIADQGWGGNLEARSRVQPFTIFAAYFAKDIGPVAVALDDPSAKYQEKARLPWSLYRIVEVRDFRKSNGFVDSIPVIAPVE